MILIAAAYFMVVALLGLVLACTRPPDDWVDDEN